MLKWCKGSNLGTFIYMLNISPQILVNYPAAGLFTLRHVNLEYFFT